MFAKNVVSIDIGTYYTKVVQGRVKGNGIYIENAQMFRTPADVMEDGRIKDLQELQGEFLNQLAGSKLKGSLATYSIVGPEVIIREIVLPTTNPKQIKSMLPY